MIFHSDNVLLCQSRSGVQFIYIQKDNSVRQSEATLSPSLVYPSEEPLYDGNESNILSEAEAPDTQHE